MPIDIKENTREMREAGQKNYTPSNAITKAPKARENASQALKFEGRRFLGTTAGGKEIWVNFEMTRENTSATPKIKVWYSANVDLLREEGAVLANRRISFGTGAEQRTNVSALLTSREKPHGAVTLRTLDWLEEIIQKCDMENPRRMHAFDIANAIFVGTIDDVELFKTRFRINDMLSVWGFRENYDK